ncbi:hypothetical protein V1389_02065 [Flavobacterium rakeshii]|uniref:hypothetical protein n=1 Tax=Flavobacterium rakeshii TaxID=1038845 RepID=UPI002E7B4715|nr:hypothetical protein [Flavobacterium rakeshii]MEE1897102.1 hypothetical protein [Flavobacterium rakeshii]
MENTSLKELPFAVTKKELVSMYINQMPERYILTQINAIIIDKRKLPKGKTPRVYNIFHLEFMEFIAVHGVPKGYQNPEEV